MLSYHPVPSSTASCSSVWYRWQKRGTKSTSTWQEANGGSTPLHGSIRIWATEINRDRKLYKHETNQLYQSTQRVPVSLCPPAPPLVSRKPRAGWYWWGAARFVTAPRPSGAQSPHWAHWGSQQDPNENHMSSMKKLKTTFRNVTATTHLWDIYVMWFFIP